MGSTLRTHSGLECHLATNGFKPELGNQVSITLLWFGPSLCLDLVLVLF